MSNIELIHGDCIKELENIADKSIDCILTDPPYKYLKNQKLEVDFDEVAFFNHVKRVLKDKGFIVLFGRGTSFYRWNTILADLGFVFKEEIIWNKGYNSSPLMAINRHHETISIHSKKDGKINKVKVPYLEMKKYDIDSICQDIKRLNSVFNNPKSLENVETFLRNNALNISESNQIDSHKKLIRTDFGEYNKNNYGITSEYSIKRSPEVGIVQSMSIGMNEKSIIRTGECHCNDNNISDEIINTNNPCTPNVFKRIDRCKSVAQQISNGMNEKTIIREVRDHYSSIHPTQKPVRLIERLLALVTKEGDIVLDPFMGSGSTGIACVNTDRQFIGMEIDEEYFNGGKTRINNALNDKAEKLF